MQTLESLERSVEAILFASGDPIELDKIADALSIEQKMVKNIIGCIRDRYAAQNSPLEIVTLGSAYQMCTRAEYAEDIRAALELKRNTPLSAAALEVLAVIAYNQPVTRSFVEQVRGVDCSSIVRGLADKGLVEECGRLNIPGKPIAYQTTANFLRTFGLDNLSQLPTLPELADDEQEHDPTAQLEGQMDFFNDDDPQEEEWR